MVVGVKGLVTSWLVIAEHVVVTVAQDLASAKLYINVTKYVLVTVSQCLSHNSIIFGVYKCFVFNCSHNNRVREVGNLTLSNNFSLDSLQVIWNLRGKMLLFSLIDDGLGDSDCIFDIVHVKVGIHVLVEEVAGFIIGEITEVIIEPL